MKKIFITIFILLIIALLIINSEKYSAITLNGILVWATYVLPCIFPFMFFTKIFSVYGDIDTITKPFGKITEKLYNVPASSTYGFFMSVLSGYPIGAKITKDLYEEGKISRGQAHRMTTFTSNCGPMFIIGTVGIGMLVSPVSGYIILFSHITSALLNGFIYRKYLLSDNTFCQIKKEDILKKNSISDTMMNSVSSILMIGGYICIFFILTEILKDIGVVEGISNIFHNLFGFNKEAASGILNGFFEVTNGCLSISTAEISIELKTILSNLIITFAGISIAFQSLSFLESFNISKKFYYLQKFTHLLLSTAISIPLCYIFL